MSSRSSSSSSPTVRAASSPGRKWMLLGAGVAVGLAVTAGVAWFKRAAARKRAAQQAAEGGKGCCCSGAADEAASSSGSSSAASGETIVIGTRSSQLALWQAHHVADRLRAKFPEITFKVLPMNTMGDIDQIKPLSDFASKGVFTKELDIATMNNTIQLAVHCMKDLPTTLPPGLFMGAVLERGDVEDVLVLPAGHPQQQSCSGFDVLPEGSIIGTSAMRRSASLAKLHPHLRCANIRGNVNTRLAKLDRGEFAAIILAKAGLERLGFAHRISHVLPIADYGYAVGQGALAVVCRSDDPRTQALVAAALEHAPTRWACEAERGVLRTLNGGCKVPITIRTTVSEPAVAPWSSSSSSSGAESLQSIHVWCSVMSMDGSVELDATHEGVVADAGAARTLGEKLGNMLLNKGADKLLEGIVDPESTGLKAPSNKQ